MAFAESSYIRGLVSEEPRGVVLADIFSFYHLGIPSIVLKRGGVLSMDMKKDKNLATTVPLA